MCTFSILSFTRWVLRVLKKRTIFYHAKKLLLDYGLIKTFFPFTRGDLFILWHYEFMRFLVTSNVQQILQNCVFSTMLHNTTDFTHFSGKTILLLLAVVIFWCSKALSCKKAETPTTIHCITLILSLKLMSSSHVSITSDKIYSLHICNLEY